MQSTPDLIAATADPAQFALAQKRTVLQARIKNDISWFYWIAALSIINSLVYIFDGGINFVVGLAITQVIDVFMKGMAQAALENGSDLTLIVRGIGLAIDLAIAGIFVLCGVFGIKRYRGWVIAGIVLYALDTLICLAFQAWLEVGFHVFALFFLIRGLQAMNELKKLDPPPAPFVSPTLSSM